MIVLVFLATFFDAVVLPTNGLLPSLVFTLVVWEGTWREADYKSWYMLALVYITIAVLFYLFGNTLIGETVVRKLSDWSFMFLLLGTVQLARFKKSKI